MSTTVWKGGNGWKAETTVEIAEGRVLRISTLKNMNGSLVTNASVCKVESTSLVHMPFSDYSKRLSTHGGVRVTENKVREVHMWALGQLDRIRAEAVAHYAERGQV